MKLDPRFTCESDRQVFTGNELLVKGALETEGGVHLLTGYPGSPVAGFFDCLGELAPLLLEKGIVAKQANNEALSLAMVNGAQMVGGRAITCFKSVGLHVASDALALGVLAGTNGDSGGLVIVGDDPWSDSTQVPADSRYLAEHVRLPIIEPSCPQEVKDWVDLAFKLGKAGQIYVGYSMTTTLADGGGAVLCKPNHYPALNANQKVTLNYEKDIQPRLDQAVLLPPRTWQRELTIQTRLDAVKQAARQLGINRILHRPQKDEVVPLGFIAAGHAFSYLAHALSELGILGRIPILKLGMYYPVDPQIVREFAGQCQQIIVIEERRDFVERQVVQLLHAIQQSDPSIKEAPKVYGKQFPDGLPGIPATRGLNPSILIERLAPVLKNHPGLPVELTNGRLAEEVQRIALTGTYDVRIPTRTPTFCPGCPHRDSSSVLLELRRDLRDPGYMTGKHQRKPVDLVCHGDTGCYTMLMFSPNQPLMHNYSGMGLGAGTGSGVDSFIDNKQLVFMGDGTFFHSGQVAISHSIQTGQDITYIILQNGTTAMTGHQPHPGQETDLLGQPIFAQDIQRIVEGLIPQSLSKDVLVVRINPADRDRYRRLLEQAILADGVKIVLADKECAITYHRRGRSIERKTLAEEGFLPRKTHMNVATEVCEYCLECTNQTGCPGLTTVETDYGPKVQTDFSWCVNDAACQRVGACPSFEEVTILRKKAPRQGDEYVDLTDLPDPPSPIHADQDVWRCYLAGVGGMGIGLCTAILTQAGFEMGYDVQFLDKKGLAIRNGGVFSQLVYTRRTGASDPASASFTTPLIPYGKADLLLGIDLLETCRAIDPTQPYRVACDSRTAMVANTAITPTVSMLMGQQQADPAHWQQTLRRYSQRYFGFNVGDLCERVVDSKLYANIMMLGIAYQLGYLPLKLEAIEKAIRSLIRHDTERNLRAFNIGRKIAVRPDLFVVELKHEYETARQAFRRKVNLLRARLGNSGSARIQVRQFRVLLKQTFRATRGLRVDDQLMRDVIIRAYDGYLWGGLDYAKRYCLRLVQVFQKDDPAFGYQITRTVVHQLAKVMLIKDEVYVASLLTSPEKYKQDMRRFNVNPSRGDRILYSHYNKPEFVFLGQKIRLTLRTQDWQLRLMASMPWLRKMMPGWHRQERQFRDWYESVVDRLEHQSAGYPKSYQRWLAILQTPQTVTGFREVRYPKMNAARHQAETWLSQTPEDFSPPPPPNPPLPPLPSIPSTGSCSTGSCSALSKIETPHEAAVSLPVLSNR